MVGENVALIRSIPRRYFDQVEPAVMRSVAQGGNLRQLSDDLRRIGKVTQRRAEFIARDQNSKALAALSRISSLEAGVTQGVWVHSGAGRDPRPSHVKAGRDRVVFDLRKGWYDPDEGRHIMPGYLINCRCTYRPVIPGFE